MSVKKIFVLLITIVACVIIGAFTLNLLLPNVVTTVVNATESMIFKATGLDFDFNNDGVFGSGLGKQFQGEVDESEGGSLSGDVEGFN